MPTRVASGRLLAGAGLAAAFGALALFTAYQHAANLGLTYLDSGTQLARHRAIIDGAAGNPWQYRILAPYLVDVLMRLLGGLGIPHHAAAAFILFRVMQDALNAALAYVYYRKLGLSAGLSLIGISVLAWSVSYASYDSDLQFSTYFDIAFYLLAGICLLASKYTLVVALVIVAALNRETSGLIPFMLLATALQHAPGAGRRRGIGASVAALVMFGGVFVLLRVVFGSQPLLVPYEHRPGWDLLWYNISRPITWIQVFSTLGIIPALAVIGYRAWPRPLAAFFWAVVPVWFLIHWAGAVAAESRLFLVPHSLVLIPGALWFAQAGSRSGDG